MCCIATVPTHNNKLRKTHLLEISQFHPPEALNRVQSMLHGGKHQRNEPACCEKCTNTLLLDNVVTRAVFPFPIFENVVLLK